LFLSRTVGNHDLENCLFRLETNGAGNGYVSEDAAENENWLEWFTRELKQHGNRDTPGI